MLALYSEMIASMEPALREIEALLRPPQMVRLGDGWVYRFENNDAHHAIALKLASLHGTLRAAMLLLEHGFVAQQAMLMRIIDEANEDILYLVLGISTGPWTPNHDRFLKGFWAEEFEDHSRVMDTHKSRDMVRRSSIQSYITAGSSDRAAKSLKIIPKVFSGFVHGAAPHIMESYGGYPPKFHLRGMLGTPRIEEYTRAFWDPCYRALLSHKAAARIFGLEAAAKLLDEVTKGFERAAGKSYPET